MQHTILTGLRMIVQALVTKLQQFVRDAAPHLTALLWTVSALSNPRGGGDQTSYLARD
jgi:hypothetical protein